MRPLRDFLLLFSLILGIQAFCRAQTPADKRLSITKEIMDDFAHDHLTSVRERFSADLKDSVSESDLKDARDGLVEIAGAFQSQISQTTRMVQGAPIYVSKSQFERYKVELKLTFDDANEITYLRIAAVSDLSPETMEASARAIADLLRQQQFDEVNSKFNNRMKEEMPSDRLRASWTHVMMHLGPFKSIKVARKDPESDRVDVRCEFENGPMVVRVAFDLAGKVSGLWMLPAETGKDSQI
ncbi:MAG TPA: DUF3887 domain-containing protein [Candidatus Acidoferrales bacterium]|nr:DUF3887 domain-containing protein [Candidatus Acidoferrales bacterium]